MTDPLTPAHLDAISTRNPGNADVRALLAEHARLRFALDIRNRQVNHLGHLAAQAERLQQACDLFEKNSEGAVKLEEALRKCLPLLETVSVLHVKKSSFHLAQVYGEEMAVRHEAGCVDHCPGCKQERRRDEAVRLAKEALGVSL